MKTKLRWILTPILIVCFAGVCSAQSRTQRRGSLGIAVRILAQTGNACGPAGGHCTVLSWSASSSAAACSPTATPPCTFAYNVFRGIAAGAESVTPINSVPISGLTFTDPVTLTTSPQSFFYTVQAVETVGTVAASSPNSNEVSDSFPGTPSAPSVTVTNH